MLIFLSAEETIISFFLWFCIVAFNKFKLRESLKSLFVEKYLRKLSEEERISEIIGRF